MYRESTCIISRAGDDLKLKYAVKNKKLLDSQRSNKLSPKEDCKSKDPVRKDGKKPPEGPKQKGKEKYSNCGLLHSGPCI